MHYSQTQSIAATAGAHYTFCDPKSAEGYTWHSPDGEVLYIGKAASEKRLAEERRMVADGRPDSRTEIGFVRLMRARDGVARPLELEYFDPAAALALAADWAGHDVDRLRAFLAVTHRLTPAQLEYLLIRIQVAAGQPTGNSAGAGLWGNQAGHPLDTLAQLAVIGSAA